MTREEFTERYIKHMQKKIEEGGGNPDENLTNAKYCAELAFNNRDGDETPEDMADAEMSYWGED